MMKKEVLPEEIIGASLVKAYEKGEVKDFHVFSCNPYACQTAFLVKEVNLPIVGCPNTALLCVLRKYRPGVGQELESIDVYDFLNGTYFVVMKLLKGSTGSPHSTSNLIKFTLQNPRIAGL